MRLRSCVMDIVEIAALRGRAPELERIAGGRGLRLPPLCRVAVAADELALCVRPDRWLLLSPPASPGATAGVWQAACAGFGAAVDLSCGLTALHLAGPAAREVLVRACRLDLDPDAFPVGAVAATIMAQVSVIFAALPSGLLLLTPSTTARHFREWLASTAKPFGFMPQSDFTVAALSGDQFS
ncbi:MAG: sarcosine oxidase subunit gamma [Steroidobacteraceae bacterium]|jgi:sarcosine oxidase, subunit gamma